MNIIPKKEQPETMPSGICIRFASKRFSTNEKDRINDISEAGIQSIIENIRNGTYNSFWLLFIYLCKYVMKKKGFTTLL